MAMDSFLVDYSDKDIDIAVEFLTTWLPFLSRNLCDPCATSLRHSISSLTPQGSGVDSVHGCACLVAGDGGDTGVEGIQATGWGDMEPDGSLGPDDTPPPAGWETPEPTGWDGEHAAMPEATGWVMESESVSVPEVVASGWETEPERVSTPEVVATGWETEPERVSAPEVVATGWEMEPEKVSAPEVVATGWEMEPESVTTPTGREMEEERVTTPEVVETDGGKGLDNEVKGEESQKVKMSWADMADDELEGSPRSESSGEKKGSPRSESSGEKKKTELSREKRELIRFRKVQRKMDYICLERVRGKLVNVISGLELHTGVFSAAEQKRIVDFVYELQEKGRKGQLGEYTYSKPKKWMRGKGRETIQFGCCYNYAKKDDILPGILKNVQSDPLPSLFKVMIKRMVRWHVLPLDCVPDSCIVNIYEPEDCIPPHIDSHDFVRPFCTVSFLSECNILFGSELRIAGPGEFAGSFVIPLPVGSVLVLKGNGADVAKHCVPAVPTKRISITFRTMDERKRPKDFVAEPDLQNIIQLPYNSAEGTPKKDTGTSGSGSEQHVSEIKGNQSRGKQSMVNQGHDLHRSQHYSYDMEAHTPSSLHRNVDMRTLLNNRRFSEPKPLDQGLLGSRPHQVTTDTLPERSAGQESQHVWSTRQNGSSEQRGRRNHLDLKQFMPHSRSGQGEDTFLMNEERNSNGYAGWSPGQGSQDMRTARLHSSSEQRGRITPGNRNVQGEGFLRSEERNSGRRGMLDQQRSVTSRNHAREDDPSRAGGYMPDSNRVNRVGVRSVDNNPRRGWASYSDR